MRGTVRRGVMMRRGIWGGVMWYERDVGSLVLVHRQLRTRERGCFNCAIAI